MFSINLPSDPSLNVYVMDLLHMESEVLGLSEEDLNFLEQLEFDHIEEEY